MISEFDAAFTRELASAFGTTAFVLACAVLISQAPQTTRVTVVGTERPSWPRYSVPDALRYRHL
jgi:hypothetical protein